MNLYLTNIHTLRINCTSDNPRRLRYLLYPITTHSDSQAKQRNYKNTVRTSKASVTKSGRGNSWSQTTSGHYFTERRGEIAEYRWPAEEKSGI